MFKEIDYHFLHPIETKLVIDDEDSIRYPT